MLRKKDELTKIISLSIDPIDSYFECISMCDVEDGLCISKCVEILRDNDN